MVFSFHDSAGHVFLLIWPETVKNIVGSYGGLSWWVTMFSSRSFNISALSLLKKNKEENTATYQESPPWLLTMIDTLRWNYSVPRVLTIKQARKHICPNHGRWKSSATTDELGWRYIEGVRRGSNTQVYSTAVRFNRCKLQHLFPTKSSNLRCTRSSWTKEPWGPAAVFLFCFEYFVVVIK